ncbi:3-methyl-2-oxobutanoate hydroxymethyltransferase [Salinisphaera sp. USBA-960]|uniref:3-methyl-2-oxobutanoate hydroxymethyltransferase n=1 Tax=Salinisphaera orenii TaxID=856731 RepID=UPI000DBE4CEE|nr:3-methyl-2-oxobutanoate hydroxymethyltransferase [Salifodinibacter halophilus]NNC25978.1 3-methyl-2-oxobutanoate hydroxymethyltransferase [Salifodinibacter halophilus]
MNKLVETRPTQRTQPVSVATLGQMKRDNQPIACLTAYDASFAALAERANMDLVLVGDSLGNVIHGQATTTSVSVDDIVYHTRCVAAGLSTPLLAADLPFLSFATTADAVASSRRLIGEGGASMVKVEGGAADTSIVETLAQNGVPVCAHLGLRPQQVHKTGGFKIQGRSKDAAKKLAAEARQFEAAGADLLLLECVPSPLARRIAATAKVPVIGIGAGPDVDGQILVSHDVIGLSAGKKPKFVRNFLASHDSLDEAVEAYVEAVRHRYFPSADESFDS